MRIKDCTRDTEHETRNLRRFSAEINLLMLSAIYCKMVQIVSKKGFYE